MMVVPVRAVRVFHSRRAGKEEGAVNEPITPEKTAEKRRLAEKILGIPEQEAAAVRSYLKPNRGFVGYDGPEKGLEELRQERKVYRRLLDQCRYGKEDCRLLSSISFYGEKIQSLNARIELMEAAGKTQRMDKTLLKN